MSVHDPERVPAAPLAEFLERKLEGLRGDVLGVSPYTYLAERLGISEKLLYRWRHELRARGRGETGREELTIDHGRTSVEEALFRADIFMWEVFPDLPEFVEEEEQMAGVGA